MAPKTMPEKFTGLAIFGAQARPRKTKVWRFELTEVLSQVPSRVVLQHPKFQTQNHASEVVPE